MTSLNTCTCCGKKLNMRKVVSLELDQRLWMYHDFGGVPEDKSQGWFPFGQTCAKKARSLAGRHMAALVEQQQGVVQSFEVGGGRNKWAVTVVGVGQA